MLPGMNKHQNLNQSGKVYFKFFLWPSIIISIVLSVLLTVLLNVLL